jgi:hypothetical protein
VVTKVKSLYLYDWSVMFICKTNLINFLLIYIPLIYLSIISVKTCHYKLCIICLFIKSGVKHHIPNSKAGLTSAVLTQGYAGKLPWGTMLIYVWWCVQHVFFFRFKHWNCWKYWYNKYMLNFIDIYTFIPLIGCVVWGPSVLLGPGLRRPWVWQYVMFTCKTNSSNFSIICLSSV